MNFSHAHAFAARNVTESLNPLHSSDRGSLIARLELIFRDEESYRRLVHCQAPDAQSFLDSFQELLDSSEMDHHLRKNLIVATQRISAKSNLFPTCYELKDVIFNGRDPMNSGRFGDIYRGEFQGEVVCLKMIRLFEPRQKEHFLRQFVKEAILTRQLSHPNVQSIYGIFHSGSQLCIISRWMENGDLNRYLVHNPDVPRLLLANDVANGLSYLHKNSIVHGDLKGTNVLIDDAGRARLAGFDISSVSDPQIVTWTSQESLASMGGTTGWQAPELFDVDGDEPVTNSMSSDVYAYGCVCYEIFTGNIPFADIQVETAIVLQVLQGARPPRPKASSPSWNAWGLTEEIWSFMERCWTQSPSSRPSSAEIVRFLEPIVPEDTRPPPEIDRFSSAEFRCRMTGPIKIVDAEDLDRFCGNSSVLCSVYDKSGPLITRLTSILQDKELYRRLLNRQTSDAQILLDSLQQILDTPELDRDVQRKRNLIVAMQRISIKSKLYPTCYELKGVQRTEEYPVTAGGFAEIYKGMFQGEMICLKRVRIFEEHKMKHVLKMFSKEAILWGQLSHSNISTIYGLFYLGPHLAIVSPWMKNGNIREYLTNNPTAPRQLLATDVGNGLSYLHDMDIIHGDLKGVNVLVDDAGRARLADFGISSVSDPEILSWITQTTPSSTGGTTNWLAPELLSGDSDNVTVKNTKESDVYAWGCVCFEIFTGKAPFANIHNKELVALRVTSGARPRPPTLAWTKWGLTEDIWSCMEKCWLEEPSQRPSATDIVEAISANLPGDTRPKPGALLSPAEFRRSQMGKPVDAVTLSRILDKVINGVD